MSTAKLTIKNGEIIAYADRYFNFLSQDRKFYRGNGWEVELTADKIICTSVRVYQDGPHKCQKEFDLVDGLVGLSGGHIDNRYAYFRHEEFQHRLDALGITAIKRENPNQAFTGESACTPQGTAFFKVYTDGQMKVVYQEEADDAQLADNLNKSNFWQSTKTYQVSAANWAVVRKLVDKGETHTDACLLYSLTPKDSLRMLEVLRQEGCF